MRADVALVVGAGVYASAELVVYLGLGALHERRSRRRRDLLAQSLGYSSEESWRRDVTAVMRFGSPLAIAIACREIPGVRDVDVDDSLRRRSAIVTVKLAWWVRVWPPARARALFAVTRAITKALPAGVGYELRIKR